MLTLTFFSLFFASPNWPSSSSNLIADPFRISFHRSITLLGVCGSFWWLTSVNTLIRSHVISSNLHRNATVKQRKKISMSMRTLVFRYWRQCSCYHRLIENNALPLLWVFLVHVFSYPFQQRLAWWTRDGNLVRIPGENHPSLSRIWRQTY